MSAMNGKRVDFEKITAPVAAYPQLREHWLRFRKDILKGLRLMGGTWDEESLFNAVLQGHVTFWPGLGAFAFAALEKYPSGLAQIAVYYVGGGDLEEADAIKDAVIDWGKSLGATRAFLSVRPAVESAAVKEPDKMAGWRRASIAYTKEL